MAVVMCSTGWSWQHPLGLQQLKAPSQALGTKATQVVRGGFRSWIELGFEAEGNSPLLIRLSSHHSFSIGEHARQSFKVEIQSVDPLEAICSLRFPLDQQLGGVGVN